MTVVTKPNPEDIAREVWLSDAEMAQQSVMHLQNAGCRRIETECGLGHDEALQRFDAEGTKLGLSPALLTVTDWPDNAQAFRKSRPNLMRYDEQWFDWRGNAYAGQENATIDRDVRAFLARAQKRVMSQGADGQVKFGLEPFRPQNKHVAEFTSALRSKCHLPRDLFTPQCWLDGSEYPPANEVIACRNCLVNIETGEVFKKSPAFFTFNALDIDFDPDAPEPVHWQQALREWWPDDDEQDIPAALQEMFGYFISADTSQQKGFIQLGPTRSGKGTSGWVLGELLGKNNVAGVSLNSFGASNFPLQPLLDKRLCIVADMRLERKNVSMVTEILLNVTGEDLVTVNRKFIGPWHGRLGVRFLLLSNTLPKFVDDGGALGNRFIVLPMRQSFLGREDLDLKNKLRGELPGILNWAIAGRRSLTARGHFLEPRLALAEKVTLLRIASPIRGFVEDCCTLVPGAFVDKDLLFRRWKLWSSGNGIMVAGDPGQFGGKLLAAYSGRVTSSKHRMGGKPVPVYRGVRLSAGGLCPGKGEEELNLGGVPGAAGTGSFEAM